MLFGSLSFKNHHSRLQMCDWLCVAGLAIADTSMVVVHRDKSRGLHCIPTLQSDHL